MTTTTTTTPTEIKKNLNNNNDNTEYEMYNKQTRLQVIIGKLKSIKEKIFMYNVDQIHFNVLLVYGCVCVCVYCVL